MKKAEQQFGRNTNETNKDKDICQKNLKKMILEIRSGILDNEIKCE